MKNIIKIILCILPFFITNVLFAQEWGIVSSEERAMTSISEDPEADAVILFDIGHIEIKGRTAINSDLEFTRHMRLKILTERGKKYAEVSIRYHRNDKIIDIQAHTMNKNWKNVNVKKNDIFEKEQKNYKEKVFTFPAVEIGSILEYKYTRKSKNAIFIEPWYFQHQEFTKLSQISVSAPTLSYYDSFIHNKRNYKIRSKENNISSLLQIDHLKYPESFVMRLQKGENDILKFIKECLSGKTQQLIDAYKKPDSLSDSFKKILIDELNLLIREKRYYFLNNKQILINMSFFKSNFWEIQGIVQKKYVPQFWEIRNIPAIKSEPYVYNLSDYYTSFHLKTIEYSYQDVSEAFSGYYKKYINDDQGMKKFTDEMIQDASNDEAKLRIMYEYVRDRIENSDSKGLFSDSFKMPHQIIKSKKASIIEKNLLLINLLNHAGFHAVPLMISTRSNGKLNMDIPQISNFNHLIVFAKLENSSLILDTKDRFCPFKLPPINDLSFRGLLIDEGNRRFMTIPEPKTMNMNSVITRARLDEDGQLHCETVIRFDNYLAAKERKIIEGNKEKYFKEKYEELIPGISITKYEIVSEMDIESSLSISIQYSIQDFAQIIGDKAYFTPLIFHKIISNPFKTEKRSFNIEYEFPFIFDEEIEITIPESYSLVEKPRNVNMKMSKLIYRRFLEVNNNIIKAKRFFQLNDNIITYIYYNELREFFSQVVNADQEQIVLTSSDK